MKRFIFIATILITFTLSCFAQSSVSSVISNLKATINNISDDSATIKLTWKIPNKNAFAFDYVFDCFSCKYKCFFFSNYVCYGTK